MRLRQSSFAVWSDAFPRAASLVVLSACASPVSGLSARSDGGQGSGEASAPISFQRDLLPGFERSCGLSSSCHQDPVTDPITQRIFLGCATTNPDCSMDASSGAEVFQGLKKDSQEDPTMPYVTDGDPSQSFILYKLEGNLAGIESQCRPVAMDPIVQGASGEPQPPQPCGAAMPLGLPPLTDFTNQVRAWIAQGAQND